MVRGSPVVLEMFSPERKPGAARNGSCMYSGSIGDSAGSASG